MLFAVPLLNPSGLPMASGTLDTAAAGGLLPQLTEFATRACFRCVSWNVATGRWRARYEDSSTGRDKPYKLIGLFEDELMAAVAADVSTVRRLGPGALNNNNAVQPWYVQHLLIVFGW
jgi:hypothetical protein